MTVKNIDFTATAEHLRSQPSVVEWFESTQSSFRVLGLDEIFGAVSESIVENYEFDASVTDSDINQAFFSVYDGFTFGIAVGVICLMKKHADLIKEEQLFWAIDYCYTALMKPSNSEDATPQLDWDLSCAQEWSEIGLADFGPILEEHIDTLCPAITEQKFFRIGSEWARQALAIVLFDNHRDKSTDAVLAELEKNLSLT